MKTIAFAGSNSSTSINQQVINHAIKHLNNVEVIKLTDYEIPMYSEDLEKSEGIPQAIAQLNTVLSKANALLISVNEHNGNISAYFKNILDWLSRNKRDFLKEKNVVLLSTSPGEQGAKNALQIIKNTLPYFGANIIGDLSIGNFYTVFGNEEIINKEVENKLINTLKPLQNE